MNQVLSNKVTTLLKAAGKHGMRFRELGSACKIKPQEIRKFREILRELEKQGIIIDCDTKIYHQECVNLQRGVVSRLNKNFGFVKLSDDSDVFVPGKFFLAAMPGDSVLVMPIPPRGSSPEGQIVKILHENDSRFSGTLIEDERGNPFVQADSLIKAPIKISKNNLGNAKMGDKVLCEVTTRGTSHDDHKIKIVMTYGDGQTAKNCAEALLDVNGISLDFPKEVLDLADELSKTRISKHDEQSRLDLRDERIFTIDGADTKDIDDAISIKKLGEYYELGVHIADVSHYVKLGSPIEKEAFSRGTSIYFADRVVPMLPPSLSNGICSLNPNEDRLAFSCIMTVDKNGKLVNFDFKKSIIRSRIKGVYSEVNAILDHSTDEEICKKYKSVNENIFIMAELADILTKNKIARGAPEIETNESYILLDENSVAIGVVPRTRGKSEVVIEEFMLMANEAASTAAQEKALPFVYRVHEPPSLEKLENLRTVLSALGIDTKNVTESVTAGVLARLIRDAKDKPIYHIVNNIVLRSMSKAKYFEEQLGHFGLVLKNYAQFTSPIRRYPDLAIHRVLTELAHGTATKNIQKNFGKYVVEAAKRSTETELKAMRLERDCDDCYKAEYMKAHIGEEFDGMISSLAPHGIYVELENSVEGLIRVDSLPKGDYDLDDVIEFTERLSGTKYRVGDRVKVKCSRCDVASGNIDFELV